MLAAEPHADARRETNPTQAATAHRLGRFLPGVAAAGGIQALERYLAQISASTPAGAEICAHCGAADCVDGAGRCSCCGRCR